ncbi:SDR family NAD(P)-dependent oxidoreductase [Saccharopolyspora sp. CA-218241]|uniref:SDR family NAD(P)-dependent oxidoreductase n=1 Tax=Saccharopolyspora sp. CA-218241 TaxID=3240027 RepID=UPI003D962BF1
MGLTGSRAVVTGASSGIGAATARALAGAGCELVLLGRDEQRLAEVAATTGGRAEPTDLTAPDGLAAAVEHARGADLLVHSAGVGWAGPVTAMPPGTAGAMIALNLTAPVLLSTAALDGMRRRGGGHLVFVASIAAVGVRDEEVYAATKAGVRAFAASLRCAAGPVRVSTVLPGAVRTPFFDTRGRYERGFPRLVEPEAVARAVLRAVRRGRREVFVPGWLAAAARVGGALPGTFERLSQRFG